MTLEEVLAQSRFARKREEKPEAGYHTVSKANISAGYYADFKYDDWRQQSPVCTSFYWGPNELAKICNYAGAEGWEQDPQWS